MSTIAETSVSDLKAHEARTDGRGPERLHHFYWKSDARSARALGVQALSICGKSWGWPMLNGKAGPGWHPVPAPKCQDCLRIVWETS